MIELKWIYGSKICSVVQRFTKLVERFSECIYFHTVTCVDFYLKKSIRKSKSGYSTFGIVLLIEKINKILMLLEEKNLKNCQFSYLKVLFSGSWVK